VVDDSHSRVITNDELLESEVDLLIPAALSNQITTKNVGNIKAKLIVELANGPISAEADKILNKTATVVPDILANAGGVTASYFEWVQNNYGYYWSYTESYKKLKELMDIAFRKMLSNATKHNLSFRESCYLLAVDKVAKAIQLRGLA